MKRPGRPWVGRLRSPAYALLTLILASAWVPVNATSEARSPSGAAHHERCHSGLMLVEVPKENVDPLVPDDYTLKSAETSPDGQNTYVRVDPFFCQHVEAGKMTGPVRWAVLSAEICARSGDTQGNCTHVEEYLLFLVTDSQEYAEWLRGGTRLNVKYVPGIVHDFARPDFGIAAYCFEAPRPSPAPFAVEGTVGAQSSVPVDVDEAQWFFQDTPARDGQRWTVTFTYGEHEDFFAPAEMTLTAEEGSEMAGLLGRSEAKPTVSLPHWIPQFELTRTVKVTP